MKGKAFLAALLGLGLFSILSTSLFCLSNRVLAQGPDEGSAQPTLMGPPITLTVRLLGTEGEEVEPDAVQPDEVSCCTSGQRLPGLVSTLATTVSGSISGTWDVGHSPYVVTGNLTIASSDALTIQPGVEVRFAGAYRLTVYGDLVANGTATAPITFTSHRVPPQPGDWYGIRFYNSGDDDRLTYVRVEFAQTGVDVYAGNGTASPIIEYSVIAHNLYDGISVSADAGSRDAYAEPEIRNNTIAHNGDDGIYVYGDGGGDYNDGYADPTIRDNAISDNSDIGIYLYGRGGSGIWADGEADGYIVGNTITGNGSYGISGYGYGGSYGCSPIPCISGSTSPDIAGNVIADNGNTGIYIRANGWGAGGYNNIGYASPQVVNNVVVNNSGSGLHASASDSLDLVNPKVVNNTVVSNTLAGVCSTDEVASSFVIYNNLIISNATGLSAYTGETPNVGCNGLWGNATDFSNYPSAYGAITTTNANGDPSDAYHNIFLDPHFVDASTRDYHLHGDSPAIDAGCDQQYAPDEDMDGDSRPQGAHHDMGADEYLGPVVLDHFSWATVSSPQAVQAPFSVTITARDPWNRRVSTFSGTVRLADTTGTISPTTSGGFVGGVWNGRITIRAVRRGVVITAVDTADAAIVGVSNAFDVAWPYETFMPIVTKNYTP